MLIRSFIFSLVLFVSVAHADTQFASRPDVKAFINELVTKDGFSKQYLEKILSSVETQPAILHLIQKPYEGMPWHIYRKHFVTENRINNGVKFWHKNQAILSKAAKEFGVPAEVIVAILGVETNYGARMSDYRVLDALATLGFDYIPRATFFRSELHQFLKLAKDHKVNPIESYGSYAGAMGMPQFMPSSIASYGVDYDHDGVIDLFHNPTDAIGSIGNYLKRHGWKTGKAIVIPATVKGQHYKTAIANQHKRRRGKTYLPIYRITELKKRFGVKPKQAHNDNQHAIVFTLKNKKHSKYWLGLNNFYVITTYNISKNYAMAVTQLAAEIKKRNRHFVLRGPQENPTKTLKKH